MVSLDRIELFKLQKSETVGVCVKMKEKFGSFTTLFDTHPSRHINSSLNTFTKSGAKKFEPEIILDTVLHRLCVQFEKSSQTLPTNNCECHHSPNLSS